MEDREAEAIPASVSTGWFSSFLPSLFATRLFRLSILLRFLPTDFSSLRQISFFRNGPCITLDKNGQGYAFR